MDVLGLMRERAGDYDCPRCRRALSGCRLAMLREDDPKYTVQVTCATCEVSFVIVLQVRDRSLPEAPAAPAAPAVPGGPPPAPPIEADELLDVHQLLSRHRGALTDLLPGRAHG